MNQAARYELALSYRALGQSALADPILAGLAKEASGPVAADAQFLIGQSHLTAGRYAEAVPLLEAYLAANPKGDVADVGTGSSRGGAPGTGRARSAWKTLATLAERFPTSRSLAPPGSVSPRPHWRHTRPSGPPSSSELVAGDAKPQTTRPSRRGRNQTDPRIPRFEPARWRAWESRSASWASQPTPPRPLPPCSSWLPPTRSRRRSRSPRAAHSKPTSRVDAAIKAYSVDPGKVPEIGPRTTSRTVPGSPFVARPVAATRRPRAFERLADDQHARNSLQSTGVTPDALLSEWGWVLLDAEKPAEADRVFSRLLKEYPE